MPIATQEPEEPRPCFVREAEQGGARPPEELIHIRIGDLDRLRLEAEPAGRRFDPRLELGASLGCDPRRQALRLDCPHREATPAAEGGDQLTKAAGRPTDLH